MERVYEPSRGATSAKAPVDTSAVRVGAGATSPTTAPASGTDERRLGGRAGPARAAPRGETPRR